MDVGHGSDFIGDNTPRSTGINDYSGTLCLAALEDQPTTHEASGVLLRVGQNNGLPRTIGTVFVHCLLTQPGNVINAERANKQEGAKVGTGLGVIGGAVVGAKIGAGIGLAGGGWAIPATVPLGVIGGICCGVLRYKVGKSVDQGQSK